MPITGHLVIAGIYNSTFFPLPLHIPFALSESSAICSSFSGSMAQTFIPEVSGPLSVLPTLGC